MKKIFTLLFATGIFAASYAQGKHGHDGNYGRNDQYTTNGHYDNRDHDRYDRNIYDQRDHSYANQRQMQMERINREYNYKVMSIQRNWYMTYRQKRLAIRDAKNERNYQIQMMNRRFNGYANNNYGNNGYGRHDDDDRR
ncbi:MAG: hypothetical protein KGM16_02195 [Bacteroidota bacterium]|nr:hypothetical protein [Bacteroidota bacterium]